VSFGGAAMGAGLVSLSAWLSRSSSSFGRYLSPEEDELTVAAEFVDRLKAAYARRLPQPFPGVMREGDLRYLRVASTHKNFNLTTAYDISFDECISTWPGPKDGDTPEDIQEAQDTWLWNCDEGWGWMIESYDFSVRHHMQRGTL